MNIDRINPLVKKYGLQSLGFFNLSSAEVKKFGMQSLVLIGPDEPNFWKIFSKSPEKLSNVLNPLDTWSKRILIDISKILNAKVFFPFDGPPHWPFYDWALRTGESFKSPINFLVHHRAGLFVSFRGALGFQSKIKKITKSELPLIPCRNCMKPCTNTCPVNAVTSEGYNNLHCKQFVSDSIDKICSDGCLVRRSCPVGKDLRLLDQSKFHMNFFLKG